MAQILLSLAGQTTSTTMEWGVAMKSLHAMSQVGRPRPKTVASLKSVAVANIAQRYMELLRLRGQIDELEATRTVRGATRSENSR